MTALTEFHDSDIDAVVLTNHLSWKYFNLVSSPRRRLGFTKDRLFMYTPVFLFRKKSILKSVFNEELKKLRETGLLNFLLRMNLFLGYSLVLLTGFTQYWIKKYIDDRKTKPNQRAPRKLQMKSIMAAFQICFVMYFISCVIFILELLSTKYRLIKVFLDFFTY